MDMSCVRSSFARRSDMPELRVTTDVAAGCVPLRSDPEPVIRQIGLCKLATAAGIPASLRDAPLSGRLIRPSLSPLSSPVLHAGEA
jgi:hypothetical protein